MYLWHLFEQVRFDTHQTIHRNPTQTAETYALQPYRWRANSNDWIADTFEHLQLARSLNQHTPTSYATSHVYGELNVDSKA